MVQSGIVGIAERWKGESLRRGRNRCTRWTEKDGRYELWTLTVERTARREMSVRGRGMRMEGKSGTRRRAETSSLDWPCSGPGQMKRGEEGGEVEMTGLLSMTSNQASYWTVAV